MTRYPIREMAKCLAALAGLGLAGLLGLTVFVSRGRRWGATDEECAAPLAGDDWLKAGDPRERVVVFTRAISIAAPAERVWPWLAQLGRGAGFYSYDRLDNGGKRSARHIVTWIPEPQPGDASVIGYLKHIDRGRQLAWWTPGAPFLGSDARMVFAIVLTPEGMGSRLVIRISGGLTGPTSLFVTYLFTVIDTIMARRQLLGIRERAERFAADDEPVDPETGERSQYQYYEVIYASGERAGVPGKERARRWHEAAKRDLA